MEGIAIEYKLFVKFKIVTKFNLNTQIYLFVLSNLALFISFSNFLLYCFMRPY